MFIKILICILAGLGAGLGTGFAGMSAAAVISPILIVLLGVDSYEAVAIALASDVLASAISAFAYGKNKNIDLKNGIPMMISILILTFIGSYVASKIETNTMGIFSFLMTILLGLKLIVKPVMTTKEKVANISKRVMLIKSIISGCLIGFICGFVGAGGGLMMLLILTSVLGYELKTAVGTSVFIMTFTALTGSVTHFALGGFKDISILITCVISTFIFAFGAAKIANKLQPKLLNRITGYVLTILGIVLLIIKVLQ